MWQALNLSMTYQAVTIAMISIPTPIITAMPKTGLVSVFSMQRLAEYLGGELLNA